MKQSTGSYRDSTPNWLKKRLFSSDAVFEMKRLLSGASINTVCESALCPNLNECFNRKRAVFMILGPSCTRGCSFCSVEKGKPERVDLSEPEKILEITDRLNLSHIVITSVTRDDLNDGGASHFANVIDGLRAITRPITIEVLVPDFCGREESVKSILKSRPDIFSHNIETVSRLYPTVRKGADYSRSLGVLKMVKDVNPKQVTKSGGMVGLGEEKEEVLKLIEDIREAGCEMLTIGQYLRPRPENIPVDRFVPPEEFLEYKNFAQSLGFLSVASAPFVRSSYLAEESYLHLITHKMEDINDRN